MLKEFSTKNVVDVTRKAVSQLIAAGYGDLPMPAQDLDYLDDQYIVDLGEKLNINASGDFEINSPADLVFRALMSQCGKIVIDNRGYVAQLPSLFVDAMNWGIFREQVLIELSDVMVDEMWNPDGFIGWTETRNGVTGPEEGARIASIEFGCYKPPVSSKLYKRAHGIMAALTTEREQLFTAFRNADEYASFVAGLYNSITNALQLKAEVYALMACSMAIAKAAANGNLISLRDEYALVAPSSISGWTNDKLMQDEGFQRFMLRRISEVSMYIRRYTAAYNDHEHVTFASDPRRILLSHAVSAAKFGVRANTFNEELLGIGDYDTVTGWQAVTSYGVTEDRFDLETASTICLSKGAASGADGAGITESSGTAITVNNNGTCRLSGIIGLVYDRLALGVTLDKRKVTTQYSASRDTVNTFYHSLINYIVNDSYPIVAFTLNSLSPSNATPEGVTLTMTTGTTKIYGVNSSTAVSSSSISGNTITVTVKNVTGSNEWTDNWGEGYFLPFKINGTTSKDKIGLIPSSGSGMVYLDGDADEEMLVKIGENDATAAEMSQKKIALQIGNKTYLYNLAVTLYT